ncbi:TIM21-domain-containing protein [Cladochytrium replicatum]|nr:TIM21-domain-containing protein [Cladochytrium replicatum]
MTRVLVVRWYPPLQARAWMGMGLTPRTEAMICAHSNIQCRGFSRTAQNRSPKWDPNYMDWREMIFSKIEEIWICGRDSLWYEHDVFWQYFRTEKVACLGLCAFGVAGYHLTAELLSPSSATAIYSDALEKIKEHEEIKNSLGEPLIGHGSGRRHRLTSREVAGSREDDTRRVIVNFAVEGTNGEAPVSAEVIENMKTKTWEFYTLWVDVMPDVLAKTDPARGNKVKRIYVIDHRPKRAKNQYKGRRRRWMRGSDVDEEDRPKGRFGFL